MTIFSTFAHNHNAVESGSKLEGQGAEPFIVIQHMYNLSRPHSANMWRRDGGRDKAGPAMAREGGVTKPQMLFVCLICGHGRKEAAEGEGAA